MRPSLSLASALLMNCECEGGSSEQTQVGVTAPEEAGLLREESIEDLLDFHALEREDVYEASSDTLQARGRP